jgi:hypothetical protein
MYNISQYILNVIYNYLDADINKYKFKLCYPEYKKIVLEAEYNIDDAIKYLSLGCYVKLKNYVNYLDPRLDKYKNKIYGCYISSNDELYKLFCCNNNLTHIAFRDDFNKTINKYPNKVTHITFGHNFNKPLDNLPDTITHLKLGYKFNKSITKLPKSLIYLELGNMFNKSIDKLPPNLKYLILGDDFNKSVTQLPRTLKYLEFGYYFNKPLDKLPDTLTQLKLGYKFNKPVDKLPSNLKKIDFSIWSLFNKDLNNLPASVKCVIVSKFYNRYIPDTISNKICTYTSAVSRARYKDYIYCSTLGDSIDLKI